MRTTRAAVVVLAVLAGVASLIVAGAVLVEGVTRYGGCTDDCHGVVFFGAGLVLLAALGVLLLVVAATVLSQSHTSQRDEVDEYLARLRARVPRD